jgi:transcriptional regulator with XRE-family HTH domain
MRKRTLKLIDQIRQAAKASGLRQNALAQAAGIDKAALCRFLSGERGLLADSLNALGDVLNLRIVAGKPMKLPPPIPRRKPGPKPKDGRKAGRK